MNITQLNNYRMGVKKINSHKKICLPPMIFKIYMEWAPFAKEKLMFKVTKIWALNPKAMDGKNRPN
jgi:hypothetical protein